MGYKIVRAILDFFFFIVFRLHVEGRENEIGRAHV